MQIAGRAYVLFVAIVFVAMATRVGWIDWQLIATLMTDLAIGLVSFLALAALLIGIPATFVIAFLQWLFKPAQAVPTDGPP